jgi:hypothetical protein
MQKDYTKQNGRGFRWDVVEYCGLWSLMNVRNIELTLMMRFQKAIIKVDNLTREN